jgi:phospholipase C
MANQLPAIQHIVQLMLENRAFDQMLGFLYAKNNNKSPTHQAFEGLSIDTSTVHNTPEDV